MPVPDISYTVEIAFGSTWQTPAASRVWTDVSAYVEFQDGINITYGRQDERGTADANTLSLTLDNSDGRFTWGNASSPYYPKIKIGAPIRVTATVGGTTTSVRFVGFINEWPTSWPNGSSGYSKAQITASSRLAWLGRSAPLGNIMDASITNGSRAAAYYWPCIEAAGATSASEVKNRANAIAATSSTGVEFGYGGDGTLGLADNRPGIRLFNTVTGVSQGYVSASVPTPVSTAVGDSFTAVVFYRVTTPAAAANDLEFVTLSGSGQLITSLPLAYSGYSVDPEAQSGTHMLALRYTRVTSTTADLTVLLDGSIIYTISGGAVPSTVPNLDTIALQTPSSLLSGIRETTVGRIALFPYLLSVGELIDYSKAPTGFAGDYTDARLLRLASLAAIPSTEVSASGFSSTTMAGIDQGDTTVVSLMRRAETTEAGVLYDDRTGVLRGAGRRVHYGATTALTIDATTQRVGSDYAPKVDASSLVNIASGRNAAGTVDVSYENAASRTAYGDYGASVDTDSQDANEPYALASWVVNANAEPQPRAPSVTTEVAHWIGDGSLSALLGLDVGSKIALTNLPTQAPSASPTYFVEGYAEAMTPGSWRITFNLSPTTAYDRVLILNDATVGLLNTNTLAL